MDGGFLGRLLNNEMLFGVVRSDLQSDRIEPADLQSASRINLKNMSLLPAINTFNEITLPITNNF